MSWPVAADFDQAIQNPHVNLDDPELKQGEPEIDRFGTPCVWSGNFASVYLLECPKRKMAVRCFLREIQDQQERYAAISQDLLGLQLPFSVDFAFVPRGIKINGNWYPILKMDWMQGELLGDFIENNIRDSNKLRALAEQWLNMSKALRRAGIAHGDLHPSNVFVVNEQLRLIDYDGMFVPTLAGRLSNELGSDHYQHPRRELKHYGKYIDNFSDWVMYASLTSLSFDGSLWRHCDLADKHLLFQKSDYLDPANSKVFQELKSHPAEPIRILAGAVERLTRMPVESLPRLSSEELRSLVNAARGIAPAENAIPPAPEPIHVNPAPGPQRDTRRDGAMIAPGPGQQRDTRRDGTTSGPVQPQRDSRGDTPENVATPQETSRSNFRSGGPGRSTEQSDGQTDDVQLPAGQLEKYKSPLLFARLFSVFVFGFSSATVGGSICRLFYDARHVDQAASGAQGPVLIVGMVMAVLAVITFGLAAIFFVIWTGRVLENLRAFQMDDPQTGSKVPGTGWMVASWFIPFGNLFLPYGIMQDIYRASGPKETAASWKTAPSSLLFPLWWVFWIGMSTASILFTSIAMFMFEGEDGLVYYRIADGLGDLVCLASGLFACLVLHSINKRLERKRKILAGEAAPEPLESSWTSRRKASDIPVILLTVIVGFGFPGASVALNAIGDFTKKAAKDQVDAAWKAYDSAKYAEAVTAFGDLIKDNPNKAAYYYGRGCAYKEQKDYDKAISDFNKTIDLEADYAEAYQKRGYIYYANENYAKAEKDLHRAVALQATDFYNNYYLGLALSADGKYDEALTYFNDAVTIKPDHANAHYNRGQTYYNKKDYEKAVDDYLQAAKLNKSDADAFYGAGLCLEHLKDYSEARLCYARARDIFAAKGNSEWARKCQQAEDYLNGR